MARQTISRPATVIPPPKSQAGRDRSWEKSHPPTSYRIPLSLRERITQIAAERDLSTAEIARSFLEHGLAAYESGELELRPVFRGKLTLFPDDE